MTVLAVAPHVDVTVIDGRGIVTTTLAGQEVFSGAAFAAVARAVDGVRTEEELLALVPGAADELAELRSAGVLVECDDALPADAAAFWATDGVRPRRVAARLGAASVSVEGLGGVNVDAVADTLRESGVRVGEDGALAIVVTDDYLRDDLAERNERALATGRPWLLAGVGVELWLGPVFVPDRGPCWSCLAQRLRLHRPFDAHLRHLTARSDSPRRGTGTLPATQSAAAAAIAATALRWIVLEEASGLDASVVGIDTRTWQASTHSVTWRPQCPSCGDPDPPDVVTARPVTLADAGDRIVLPGTLRTVAAESTLERFGRHVSPVSGVVHTLARSAGARAPLHAYSAGEPEPTIHGERPDWLPPNPVNAGGKGTTDEQARASALCEALERYSGRFGGEEPRRRATFEELGDDAVHPNAVMGFSEAQYAAREEANAAAESFRTAVPAPFDPAAEIDWTPAWSLTDRRERLLPTTLCYYNVPDPGDQTIADSNGNAAGNTIEEAILQGFLELVERDHVALWWYNRLPAPGIDLAAIADPWLEQLRARFAEDERELWALDLTADLGIPVVAAVATPPGDPNGPVTFGFGAHFDLGLATQRAATELVQLSVGVASAGLGHSAAEPPRPGEDAYLRPTPGVAAAPVTVASSGDLRLDVDACVDLLAARGLELIVLDQTRADVGLPVVKVLVPGLRHFWPRFGTGRLYDVPVALGRLDAPRDERDLNRLPPVA